MAQKNKKVTFKTLHEFKSFYASDNKNDVSNGSKYYRIGEEIARSVCEKAVAKLTVAETPR